MKFKFVPGLVKRFLVSEYGDVYDLWTIKRLKPENGYWGYPRIPFPCFYIKGLAKIGIHRLVALAFIEEMPDNKPIVNHKDGCKFNNHYTNLEYVSESENTKHAVAMGRTKKDRGVSYNGSHSTDGIQIVDRMFYHLDLCPKELSVKDL